MAKKSRTSKLISNSLPLAEGRPAPSPSFAADATLQAAVSTAARSKPAQTSPTAKPDPSGGEPVSTPVGRAGQPSAIAAAAAAEARERRQERQAAAPAKSDDGDRAGSFAGMVAATGDGAGGADKAVDPMVLRKKDFILQVAERSGLKKPDARRAIDAFLDVFTETLKEGRTLALTPRAKIKPVRQTDAGNATVVTAKVRIKDVTKISDDGPLAQSED